MNIYYLPLAIFSFFINYFYASLGVLPIDTFAYVDTGYRILNNEKPFVDYWTTSGPFIDIIVSFFFKILGTSWAAYVISSSTINLLISLLTFHFFLKINIKTNYSFFYSICFATLANPSMGTPFADHYSSFFSLAAIYFLILGLLSNNKIYFILIPLSLFFGFFCKQTPSGYVFFLVIIFFTYEIFFLKKFSYLKYLLIGSAISVFLFLGYVYYNNIDLNLIFLQYILFPKTIGSARLSEFEFSFKNIILNYKFIYIFLTLLIFFLVKNIKITNYKKINLILFFSSFIFIFHQILTWNFIFIFFLIPILSGVIHSNLTFLKSKKKILLSLTILLCVFSTAKYHLRFNEQRKMINLENINLSNYIDAEVINNKLKGLKWISFNYADKPQSEIIFVKKFLEILEKDKKKIMIITNYQFFSFLLNKQLNSPSRWFERSVAYPDANNKYFNDYVFFIKKLIEDKRIETIYVDNIVKKEHDYVIEELINNYPKNCVNKEFLEENIIRYQLLNCF